MILSTFTVARYVEIGRKIIVSDCFAKLIFEFHIPVNLERHLGFLQFHSQLTAIAQES